jgi:cytochrome c oxidase subunit IV
MDQNVAPSSSATPGTIAKPQTKVIWRTFWILLAITGVEFVIAFTVEAKGLKAITFVLLTFVKAFFIVAEFMHLKHEHRTLILSIVIPVIFVVWLVIALLMEGASIFGVR